MTLNSSSVCGRLSYLSRVPGVRYKEGTPEGHCQTQWKFSNRDALNTRMNRDDLLPLNTQYPFVNHEQELVPGVISAITPTHLDLLCPTICS